MITHEEEVEIWARVEAADLAGDVRRLCAREVDRHFIIVRRIYTAVGYDAGGPGIQMLCNLLVKQRELAAELCETVSQVVGPESPLPVTTRNKLTALVDATRRAFGSKLQNISDADPAARKLLQDWLKWSKGQGSKEGLEESTARALGLGSEARR